MRILTSGNAAAQRGGWYRFVWKNEQTVAEGAWAIDIKGNALFVA